MYQPVEPATPRPDSHLSANRLSGMDPSVGASSTTSFYSAKPLAGDHGETLPFRDDPRAVDLPFSPPEPENEKAPSAKKTASKWTLRSLLAVALVVIVIVLAVVLPVYFKVIRPNKSGTSSSSTSSSTSSGSPNEGDNTTQNPSGDQGRSADIVTGGDGSEVTTEDGSKFTYKNTFGGYWLVDPSNPFNDGARAQSWSPALNESWKWGEDVIRGVNLGGWLNTEPFITPALFEPYLNASTPAIDEWTLCENLAQNGGVEALENHYKTFITEEDFAMIAGAGLNWIRLPIPYWAIEKYDGEPFLEGVSWKYALKAFQWARKYGLRVNLDLHAVPGSQNGYNHSGKWGKLNFMYGTMGYANAQRTLNHIRILTEFISQPEWANVIPMFGVINEARVADIGQSQMTSFYLNMYDMMRKITGVGAGKGPFISVHDGFQGLSKWVDFLPGADRIALDNHAYLVFSTVDTSPIAEQVDRPCRAWSTAYNNSWTDHGVTISGEWSMAINDCGLYINGVGSGNRYEGTLSGHSSSGLSCEQWDDYSSWTQATKDNFKEFALSSMDALQQYFFWTWKIGPSSVTGKVQAPMWSYRLGLENGWMPLDPRESVGKCGGGSPIPLPLPASRVGGEGSDEISSSVRTQFPWPPAELEPSALAVTLLPSYTATGAIPTLTAPSYTVTASGGKITTVSGGDGWFDDSDKTPAFTPISGCTYPDPWEGIDAAVPPVCTGAKRVRGVVARPRAT